MPTIEHRPAPIQDAFDMFMLECEARRFTQATQIHYKSRVGAFVAFCNAETCNTLQDITPTLVRRFMVSLQAKGLAAYTQHAYYRAIRAWLNFCVAEEMLTTSPLAKVKAPKLPKLILPALTVEQAKKVIVACKSDREHATVLFLLDTGVRAAELCGLNGSDINTKSGAVMIRQGKGQKDRQVYLGTKARKHLLRYYIERGRPEDKQPVWISEKTGKRLTRSGLAQMLRKLSKRAGVTVTAHMLRRTFALWSLRSGMNIYVLQRLMGHEDIAILRRYLELVEDDLQQGHERFGAVDNNL